MGPRELTEYLLCILEHDIRHSVMLWGKPGIGKSSIVRQLTVSAGLGFVDVRLSQIMPSDLRGIPVPQEGVTKWAPPSFLPVEGRGVLFLDEINMAPPALQGVAQQLILDRRVGDYVLPDGWYTWAAGNRADDRAVVYEMPAPLANRFLHAEVDLSLDDFKQYAFSKKINESIIGFLSFKPTLLHKPDSNSHNWPSPRSWEMASSLLAAGLSIETAVGQAVTMEFDAFNRLREQLPDIPSILAGKKKPDFPAEPSVGYATVSAMVAQTQTVPHAEQAFFWMIDKAGPEWVQLFASDLFPQLRERELYTGFAKTIVKEPRAVEFLQTFVKLAA